MTAPPSRTSAHERPKVGGSSTVPAVFGGKVVLTTSLPSANSQAKLTTPWVVGRVADAELMRVWSLTIDSYGASVTCA